MKPSELYESLLDATLESAWGQWTAIGVAGVRAVERTIVDPEALALATTVVGRFDARLFDEVLDWITLNSRRLDVARLRRLAKQASAEQRRLVGVVARFAGQHGSGEALAGLPDEEFIAREAAVEYGKTPLFFSQDRSAGQWVSHDELFERAGFARPSVELRGLSARPDTSSPSCLRFRVRALVGMGARAEVLVYLLTHEWAHGRLIAERAAYGQAPVADYLAALADASLAEKRTEGRKTLYRATGALRRLGAPAPVYVDWVRAWPALVALLEALRPTEATEESTWMRVAGALSAYGSAMRTEGLEAAVGDIRGWAKRGPESLADAVEDVIRRVRDLAA